MSNGLAVFKIYNSIVTIDFLAPGSPYILNEWAPVIPGFKGGGVIADSPLFDYRRITSYQWETTVENLTFAITTPEQDQSIRAMQELLRLLQSGVDYWSGGRVQPDPVIIEARAHLETESRYAVLVNYRLPQVVNPFTAPFYNVNEYSYGNQIALTLEHNTWQSTVPGEGDCLPAYGTLDDICLYYSIDKIDSGDVPSTVTPFIQTDGTNSIDGIQDDAFTAEGYFKIDEIESGQQLSIFVKGTGEWFLRANSDGSIEAEIETNSTDARSVSSNINIVDGEWHHLAMTYDDGGTRQIRLWVDGQEVAYATQVAAAGTVELNDDLRFLFDYGLASMGWQRISDVLRYTTSFEPAPLCDPPGVDANTLWQVNLVEGSGNVARNESTSDTPELTVFQTFHEWGDALCCLPGQMNYLYSPIAGESDDVLFYAAYDTPNPEVEPEQNFSVDLGAQTGQAPSTASGGLIGRPGKYGYGVQTGEAAENIVENPSLETNTTGWATGGANTIAQSTEQAYVGSNSLKVTYQDNTATLAQISSITLTAAAHVTGAWIYVPASYDGTDLRWLFSGFVGATGLVQGDIDMTIRDQWQFVVAYGTPDAGDLSGQLLLQEVGSAPTAGEFIYIDAAACYASAYWLGYCLGPETLVLSGEGFKTLDNIKIGDCLIGPEGEKNTVIDKWDVFAGAYEIKLKNGFTVIASDEHRFLATRWPWDYNKTSGWRYRTTEELEVGDYLRLNTSSNITNDGHEPDLAYLLGHLIGDGYFCSSDCNGKPQIGWTFGINNKALAEKVHEKYKIAMPASIVRGKETYPSLRNSCDREWMLTTYNSEIASMLHKRGVPADCGASGKRIPDIVWDYGLVDLVAFLSGMIDSDGSVDKDGAISYNSISETLVKELGNLLSMRLGVNGHISSFVYDQNSSYGGQGTTWRIRITKADSIYLRNMGLSPEVDYKQDRLLAHDVSHYKRREHSKIESITPLGKRRLIDITLQDGHEFIANGFVTHNCDGSLGAGHAWTGTAHASTSTRTVTVLAYANPLSDTAGTISMWWIPYSDQDGPDQSLFDEGSLEAYYQASDDRIYFTDGTNTISTPALTFSAYVEQHLAFVYGNSGLAIYRNGVSVATGGTYTAPVLGSDIYIGSTTVPDDQANGVIDDLAIMDEVLSSEEIEDIFESEEPFITGELTSSCDGATIAWANKRGAPLTHAFVFDDSAGTYSANLLEGAPPYNLFPDPANQDDILYIGSALSAFSSVLFNIASTGFGTLSVLSWQYWDGATWSGFPSSPGTQFFGDTGNLQAVFRPGDDWVQTIVNGVSAFWIRVVLGVAAVNLTPPVQQSEHLFTPFLPYIEVAEDSIGGDIPALVRAAIDHLSGAGLPDRFIATRSVDRGEDFSAVIDASSRVVDGWTQGTTSGDAVVPRGDFPTGYARRFTVNTTVCAGAVRSTWSASGADYFGRFRVFARLVALSGASEDVLTEIAIVTTYGDIYRNSDVPILVDGTNIMTIDYGIFEFPDPLLLPGESGLFSITINFCLAAAGSIDVDLMDIWIMPIDEWVGQYDGGSIVNNTVIDSLQSPRESIRVFEPGAASIDNVVVRPFTLQANRRQRIYSLGLSLDPEVGFVAGNLHGDVVELQKAQRYLQARGNR
jgi:hypothetical protein